MSTFPRGPFSLLLMSGGLVVWSSCFIFLYGGMSLACAYGVPDFRFAGLDGINWLLVLLWLAHLVPLALMTWASARALRRAGDADRAVRFGWRTTCMLNVVSLFGTVWIGFPVLFMIPCL